VQDSPIHHKGVFLKSTGIFPKTIWEKSRQKKVKERQLCADLYEPKKNIMSTSASLPLPNEDEINLALCPVSVTDANARMSLITSNVRLNGNPFDNLIANIPEAQIDILYDEVSGYCTPEKGCVTALQIFYGVKEINGVGQMFPIYQSIFLKFDHYDASSETYIYLPEQYGSLWSFDGTEFVASSQTELEDAQTKFQNEITIKHSPSSTSFEPFVVGTDIESVIAPFQEIYTVLHDNDNTLVEINYGMDTILNENTYPYKMSTLFSSALVNDKGPFAGIYANRQTKVPPPTSAGIGYALI
jgi:hypothetical protein